MTGAGSAEVLRNISWNENWKDSFQKAKTRKREDRDREEQTNMSLYNMLLLFPKAWGDAQVHSSHWITTRRPQEIVQDVQIRDQQGNHVRSPKRVSSKHAMWQQSLQELWDETSGAAPTTCRLQRWVTEVVCMGVCVAAEERRKEENHVLCWEDDNCGKQA